MYQDYLSCQWHKVWSDNASNMTIKVVSTVRRDICDLIWFKTFYDIDNIIMDNLNEYESLS